ncbi:MAG: GAF domain-containing protein, partial [Nitrospira sp.]|nr:GAF domain-containing protein [Nitrospira sp.]
MVKQHVYAGGSNDQDFQTEDLAKLDRSQEVWFQEAKKGNLYISQPQPMKLYLKEYRPLEGIYPEKAIQKSLIVIAMAHRVGDQTRGVLMVTTTPDFLYEEIERLKPELGQAFIINSKGRIIAHNNKNLIGTELKGTLAQAILKQPQGQMTYEKNLVIYQQSQLADWKVGIYVPERQILKPINTLRSKTGWIIGVTLVLVGIAVTFFTRRLIIVPLKEMVTFTEAIRTDRLISSGSLTARIIRPGEKLIPITQRADEVGQLASAFQRMARDVYDREQRLKQQNEYLAALYETTLAIMNRLNLTDLLETLIARAGALLGTPHGSVWLVEVGEEAELVQKVRIGAYSELASYQLRFGEGFAGKIWQTGQPLVLEDYRTWPGRLPGPSFDIFRAAVGVPLKSGQEVVGVINLASIEEGRSFRDEEVALLSRFAELASIALDNAQLYTSAQQELTERKRAEEALATEKERLAVTLRSIGDGVITTDTEGKITLINKIAETLTGWTQEETIGKPLHEVFHIIHEKTRVRCENPVERVLKIGQIIDLANHTVLIAKDGTEHILADSGAPIRDQEGRVIGVVLVFRDVTEQRKLQEERQRANKLESVGILAGGIAHDFNNILTAILLNISLAKVYTQGEEKLFKILVEAEKACLRAKDLT